MTAREKDLLNYIIKFKTINGFSPTGTEIQQALNTKSKSHVTTMLEHLQEEKKIIHNPNIQRSIIVLGGWDD